MADVLAPGAGPVTDLVGVEERLRGEIGALHERNRRLQEALRFKCEFLASMAHDLRTPLNGILGFAEIMHDGKVGAISEKHKEYLGDILLSARRLTQLIDDVLSFACVDSGKLEFRPGAIDPRAIAGDVRNVLRSSILRKQIDLEVEVEESLVEVVVDPSKLKQVLHLCLARAITLAPEAGRISARFRSEGTEAFRLEVELGAMDAGPEEIESLGLELRDLGAAAPAKDEGLEVGLALAARIAEAQGGRVEGRIVPGKGCVFSVVLPRVQKAR